MKVIYNIWYWIKKFFGIIWIVTIVVTLVFWLIWLWIFNRAEYKRQMYYLEKYL